MSQKNQLTKSESYILIDYPERIEAIKIELKSGITNKQIFSVNKKRLSGVTFDNPVKVYNLILTLWQKKQQKQEPLMS